MRKFFQFIGVVVVVGFLLSLLAGGLFSSVMGKKERVSGDAIMKLELDGIILDGKTFLKQIKK